MPNGPLHVCAADRAEHVSHLLWWSGRLSVVEQFFKLVQLFVVYDVGQE